MIKKLFKKIANYKWLLYFLTLPVFAIGYKTNNLLINSFGCFDDCHVYSTAYFMLTGKKIYSEIFFNHNPLMPYLSLLIQSFTDTKSIYEFLLRHRQFIFMISVFFNIILLVRFRYKALGFILIFELTKFYTFGNRFLPEAVIVYPIVYLFGLCWEKIQNQKISRLDLFLAGIFAWFIIFMREPYVPVALFLFTFLLWKSKKEWSLISLGIFTFLSIIALLSLPLKDFYFNVVTFNLSETVGKEISASTFFGVDFLKIFFYPFYILFPTGDFGYFRQILIIQSLFFTFLLVLNLKFFSKKLLLFLFITLSLANIRFTEPGTTYYSSYHMNIWYGLFIFSLMLFYAMIKNYKKKMIATIFLIAIVLFSISSQSIIWQKIDQQEELLTNYGPMMLHILIINKLSSPSDTLFLDGWDELIYSQTKLPSSYKYSHFTSQMPNVKLYQNARNKMFSKNPPVFYYGTCNEDVGQKIPLFIKNQYVRIYHMNKPTCLYVLKEKYEKIENIDPEISFKYE